MECLDEEFAVAVCRRRRVVQDGSPLATCRTLLPRATPSANWGGDSRRFWGESRLHARETPEDAGETWPEFIVELATLERALYEVDDGPRTRAYRLTRPCHAGRADPEAWQEIRLVLAPCLRLLAFSHDASGCWGDRKDELAPVIPMAERHWLAICRRDFVVERFELDEPQFVLLEALIRSETLLAAISAASAIALWMSSS